MINEIETTLAVRKLKHFVRVNIYKHLFFFLKTKKISTFDKFNKSKNGEREVIGYLLRVRDSLTKEVTLSRNFKEKEPAIV